MALSRAEMEAVINAGGSVLHGDKIITSIGQLPTEAALALGDAEATRQANESLDQQIKHLMAQKMLLAKGSAPPELTPDPSPLGGQGADTVPAGPGPDDPNEAARKAREADDAKAKADKDADDKAKAAADKSAADKSKK